MRKTRLDQRFWEKVSTYGPEPDWRACLVHPEIAQTRCWLWTGALNDKGRGTIKVEGKDQKAHRVAWFLATGLWPESNVLHKCDITNCIRFSHLFEGTQKENAEDRELKGRSVYPPRHTKLNSLQVLAIRTAFLAGVTKAALAKQYHVVHGTIRHIISGRNWKGSNASR